MARMTTPTNTRTSPLWCAQFMEPNQDIVPGGSRLVSAEWLAQNFTFTTSGALAAATSIPLTVAAPVALPAGTVLDWSGIGELSRTSAAIAAGAMAIPVEALDAAIEAGDTATYSLANVSPISVPSGTLIGRTRAERDANTGFGVWAAGDEEVYLTPFDVVDVVNNADVELLRNTVMVYENWLPNWATLTAGAKAEIRARYQCIVGKEVA